MTEAKRLSWIRSKQEEPQSDFSFSPSHWKDKNDGSFAGTDSQLFQEQRLFSDSVLILRIALIRIDNLISRAEGSAGKEFLIERRKQLHELLDEIILYRSSLNRKPIMPRVLTT